MATFKKAIPDVLVPGTVGMDVADFDGDGSDDILYRADSDYEANVKPPHILSLRGQPIGDLQPLTNSVFGNPPFNLDKYELTCWAFGPDKRAVTIAEAGEDMECRLIDARSRQVGKLHARDGGWGVVKADFDGDGVPELLLRSHRDLRYLDAFSYTGKVVWSCELDDSGNLIAGDVDGDGRDELLVYDRASMKLIAYGKGQSPKELQWPKNPSIPHGTADLNGDGVDEIIDADSGFFDPASGHSQPFEFPVGRSRGSSTWGNRFAVGDYDHDGAVEVAILAPLEPSKSIDHQGLYSFTGNGSLLYAEDLGEIGHEIKTVRTAGKDYLAILLSRKLIVYP